MKRLGIQNVAYLFAIVVVLLVAFAADSQVEVHFINSSKQDLRTTLRLKRDALRQFSETTINLTQILALNDTVRDEARKLLELRSTPDVTSARAQAPLRTLLTPLIQASGFRGYFLIDPDGTSLASSRDSNIGTKNLLASTDYFRRALGGESLVTKPMPSDVPLRDVSGQLKPKVATMFALSPITDFFGDTIALLAVRIDPFETIYPLLSGDSKFKKTETVLYDKAGNLLSPVSEVEGFFAAHSFDTDYSPIFIYNLEPYYPEIVSASAQSNAEPYVSKHATKGLLGEDVFHGWIWDQILEIGIHAERSEAAAMATYTHIQRIIQAFTLVIVLLIVTLAVIISQRNRQRQLALLTANQELEARVKERTAELELQKEEALAASRAKTDFLANMSHEIRTPLNGVLGMTELLKEEPLNDNQEEFVATIANSGKHLLSIINDILDYSKIGAGKIELDPTPTKLSSLGESLEKICQAKIAEKNLSYISNFAPELPEYVLVDETRLRQVLLNLLSNALKFTPAGGAVIVQLIEHASKNDIHTIEFSVSDTGVGIPEHKIEHIFGAFDQADSSVTREWGGTGLGLSISQHLVQLMGGELLVDSVLGKGTRFYFTLQLPQTEPVEEATPAISKTVTEEPLSPLRILVAEDNVVNQRLIIRFLEKAGHAVTLAGNGAEAVQCFQEDPYDLILMDIQMPVMGGEEALALIRNSKSGKDIPIIALTAHAMAEHKAHYLSIGMDGYVSKPIDRKMLFDEMRRVTQEA